MSRKSTSSILSSSSSSSSSCRSSYSTGTASIIVNDPTCSPIKPPPRKSSLNFRQILLQSPHASLLSLFEDEYEDVDLTKQERGSKRSSSSSSSSNSSISAASTSATNHSHIPINPSIIAAAIQLSSLKGESISSLSNGNVSILRRKSRRRNNQQTIKEAPQHLFRWNSTGSNESSSISTQQQHDHWLYTKSDKDRRAKEFVNTLHPMVEPSLFDLLDKNYIQKPQFAFFRY